MLYSLFVINGKDCGRSFVLTDQRVTIGRDQENSVLLQDKEVSRLHCSLFTESSQTFLIDEGSSNGTFLNGAAITRAEVHEGDKIRIGKTQFEFNSLLRISLDNKDSSPLTASPARVNKNSLKQKQTKFINQSEIDTNSVGFDFGPDDFGPNANRQISAFTEHRINNLMQGLNGGAHLVQAGLDSEDFELCKKGWEVTRGNQVRIMELVRDLLALNRELVLEPKFCDLAEMIVDAATQMKTHLDNASLACQFPPVGETFASVDRGSLQTCLQYLLRLVIDTASGKGALLEFSILQDHQMLHLTVRYPGPPIQTSPPQRADAKADFCGIAGLLVRKIVEAHNGDLTTGVTKSPVEAGPIEPEADSVFQSEAILSFPLETN